MVDCFPQWLYCFVYVSGKDEGCKCFHSLPFKLPIKFLKVISDVLMHRQWCLGVVFNQSLPMTNGTLYLFMPTSIIPASSLMKYLFKSFAHLYYVVFLLLSFEHSLWIIYTNPSSDMNFANISSQLVADLFILTVPSEGKEFVIFMRSNLSTFFF